MAYCKLSMSCFSGRKQSANNTLSSTKLGRYSIPPLFRDLGKLSNKIRRQSAWQVQTNPFRVSTSLTLNKIKIKYLNCIPTRLHISLRRLKTFRKLLRFRFRCIPVMCIQWCQNVPEQCLNSPNTFTATGLWICWPFTNHALADEVGHHQHLKGNDGWGVKLEFGT